MQKVSVNCNAKSSCVGLPSRTLVGMNTVGVGEGRGSINIFKGNVEVSASSPDGVMHNLFSQKIVSPAHLEVILMQEYTQLAQLASDWVVVFAKIFRRQKGGGTLKFEVAYNGEGFSVMQFFFPKKEAGHV
jgi:hypothetical protein